MQPYAIVKIRHLPTFWSQLTTLQVFSNQPLCCLFFLSFFIMIYCEQVWYLESKQKLPLASVRLLDRWSQEGLAPSATYRTQHKHIIKKGLSLLHLQSPNTVHLQTKTKDIGRDILEISTRNPASLVPVQFAPKQPKI